MANPIKVILACDESGAKGYANQDETYTGEVGIFAGILIPDECLDAASPKFQEIYDRYKPASGKPHMRCLPDHLKPVLRQDVYGAIRDLTLPCFWYAIHVAGLHESHRFKEVICPGRKGEAAGSQRGNGPRVKPGRDRKSVV